MLVIGGKEIEVLSATLDSLKFKSVKVWVKTWVFLYELVNDNVASITCRDIV